MFKIIVLFMLMHGEQAIAGAELDFTTEATTKAECEEDLATWKENWVESNPTEGTLNWRWVEAFCEAPESGA